MNPDREFNISNVDHSSRREVPHEQPALRSDSSQVQKTQVELLRDCIQKSLGLLGNFQSGDRVAPAIYDACLSIKKYSTGSEQDSFSVHFDGLRLLSSTVAVRLTLDGSLESGMLRLGQRGFKFTDEQGQIFRNILESLNDGASSEVCRFTLLSGQPRNVEPTIPPRADSERRTDWIKAYLIERGLDSAFTTDARSERDVSNLRPQSRETQSVVANGKNGVITESFLSNGQARICFRDSSVDSGVMLIQLSGVRGSHPEIEIISRKHLDGIVARHAERIVPTLSRLLQYREKLERLSPQELWGEMKRLNSELSRVSGVKPVLLNAQSTQADVVASQESGLRQRESLQKSAEGRFLQSTVDTSYRVIGNRTDEILHSALRANPHKVRDFFITLREAQVREIEQSGSVGFLRKKAAIAGIKLELLGARRLEGPQVKKWVDGLLTEIKKSGQGNQAEISLSLALMSMMFDPKTPEIESST